MSAPRILAIETSCDETGVAVVEDGRRIVANQVASQLALHAEPAASCRRWRLASSWRIVATMRRRWRGRRDWDEVDARGGHPRPGPHWLTAGGRERRARHSPPPRACRWWGSTTSRGTSTPTGFDARPRSAPPEPPFPLLCLVVCGGHTELVLMEDHGGFRLLGRTADDAAGEAFDKVGRILGLGIPADRPSRPPRRAPTRDALPRARPRARRLQLLGPEDGRAARSGGLPSSGTSRSRSTAWPPPSRRRWSMRWRARRWPPRRITAWPPWRWAEASPPTALCGRPCASGSTATASRSWSRPPAWCTDNGAMIGAAAGYRVRGRRSRQRGAGGHPEPVAALVGGMTDPLAPELLIPPTPGQLRRLLAAEKLQPPPFR